MNDLNNQNNGNQPGHGNGNMGPGDPNRRKKIILIIAAIAALFFFFWTSSSALTSGMQEEIDYSVFVDMLDEGTVEYVGVEDEVLYITPKTEEKETLSPVEMFQMYYYGQSATVTYVTAMMEDYSMLTARLEAADVEYGRPIPGNAGNMIYLLLTSVLPLVLMVVFFTMMMKRMGGKGGMGFPGMF